jgi:hypothetical protein
VTATATASEFIIWGRDIDIRRGLLFVISMTGRWCPPKTNLSEAEKDRLYERLEAQIVDFCIDDSSDSVNSADFENNKHIVLRRFLEVHGYDLDSTMKYYEVYAKWRKEVMSFRVEENSIADGGYQPTDTFAKWNGVDQKGRPCCFIASRQFEPRKHRKHHKAFEKFLIETIETGCILARGCESQHVGIVYDRRLLTWDNIDMHLYQKVQACWSNIRKYYSGWLGVVYIIQVNWILWLLYIYVFKPLLSCINKSREIVVLREAKDILEYISEDNLPHGFLEDIQGGETKTDYIDEEKGSDVYTVRVQTPPSTPLKSSSGSRNVRARTTPPPSKSTCGNGTHSTDEANETEMDRLIGTGRGGGSQSNSWFASSAMSLLGSTASSEIDKTKGT